MHIITQTYTAEEKLKINYKVSIFRSICVALNIPFNIRQHRGPTCHPLRPPFSMMPPPLIPPAKYCFQKLIYSITFRSINISYNHSGKSKLIFDQSRHIYIYIHIRSIRERRSRTREIPPACSQRQNAPQIPLLLFSSTFRSNRVHAQSVNSFIGLYLNIPLERSVLPSCFGIGWKLLS